VADLLGRLFANRAWLDPIVRGERSMRATLLVAARNTALDRLRRRAPTLLATLDEQPGAVTEAREVPSLRERARSLQRLIRAGAEVLPVAQRATLLLDARLAGARAVHLEGG